METPSICQDDLQDVAELSKKIEAYILKKLEGIPVNLAMSALISSNINCLLALCKNQGEVFYYRTIFVGVLDNAIRTLWTEK